jgi:predicted phosphate transport protein (TIGR00153 family)
MFIFRKEKEVIELISRHAEKVAECLSMTAKTLQSYLLDDIPLAKRQARQVDHVETEADSVRHQIRDQLYYGAYMPLLREDIYKLVESMDTVANRAEKCCDIFLNQRPVIPEMCRADFSNIIQASLGVSEPLKHAALCYLKGICPIEVSRQHSKDIGLVESKVDSMEWDLTKKIFSSDLAYSHKIHLRICLDVVVEVTDCAEDAADQLDLVILKSMV